MGRELKRVPLDFVWPLNEPWRGYVNPLHCATKCAACDGTGSSPEARHLRDLWYGYTPFRPEDRGPRAQAFNRLAGRNTIIGRHERQRDEIGDVVGHDCYSNLDHAPILFSFRSHVNRDPG